jgi:molybdate transport system substrate-binding protein
MRTRVTRMAALIVGFVVAVVACGFGSDRGSDEPQGSITVFAASSLTDAFTELGTSFEAAHPGTHVTFSFAASSELVAQINEGAPADVFASADETSMAKLADADADGANSTPIVFARNRLAIVVEPGNPLSITSLGDLGRDDVTVVLCDETVPCGMYAHRALDEAGVTVHPASLEDKVKGVVSKVTLGEADAGIVYATDVLATGEQGDGVEIPDEHNVIATYPIVATAAAGTSDIADAFVAFVVSTGGLAILAKYGFLAP